jgi:hypothetical protein
VGLTSRNKPRLSLQNNTPGVCEREDENRTREAGNRDEVEGGVANTLNLYRNGASLLANSFGVGFIDWLGVSDVLSIDDICDDLTDEKAEKHRREKHEHPETGLGRTGKTQRCPDHHRQCSRT